MLVGDERFVQVMEKCLYAMFGFQLGLVHVSKDVLYGNNNVVISSIYQFPSFGPQGLHWMVNNGRYRTIGESLVKNSQDIVLTSGMDASIVNCVFLVTKVKADLDNQLVHFGSSKQLRESTFIDLYDLSDEDENFAINFNMFNACE